MSNKNFFLAVFFVASAAFAFPQNMKRLQFHNKNITDILMAVAAGGNMSIIWDETVEGTGSLYFSEGDIRTELETFLKSKKMFLTEEKGVLHVSKILCAENNGTLTVRGYDVRPVDLVGRISEVAKVTVVHEGLPEERVSVEAGNMETGKVLELVMEKFTEYSVIERDGHFLIRKNAAGIESVIPGKNMELHKTDSGYSLSVNSASMNHVLKKLMEEEGKEFVFFSKNDFELENIFLENKPFTQILDFILEQGNCDYILKDGTYCILERDRKIPGAKIREIERIEPVWTSVQEIVNFLPSEFTGSQSLKIDRNGNTIYFYGTANETAALRKIIDRIDEPNHGMGYRTILLKHMDAKKVIPIIPKRFQQANPVQIGDTNAILACGSNESLCELERFLASVDMPQKGTAVKLKYLKAEEILKNPTPALMQMKEMISETIAPDTLFFSGSSESLENFLSELEILDRPKPQIKYQLLVVQYNRSSSSSIKPSVGITKSDEEPECIFSGDLSNITALNFDVIAKFGYKFAAALNAQLAESSANVSTDTTLTAISGEEIKFQNTDTYRYIEYEYDKSSGKTTNSFTQQITSGLIVTLNGWISGDGMITINVNATVSKQNTDSTPSNGKTTGTLPSTSERVVTTQLRTFSGKPAVISGLLKDEVTESKSRMPWISRIPLLGRLFCYRNLSKEKNEIVIYIVPYLMEEKAAERTKFSEYMDFLGLKEEI